MSTQWCNERYTCRLRSNQGLALLIAVQGNHTDCVLRTGLEALQLCSFFFSTREDLMDSILRARVGHPVLGNVPLWAFPGNFDGIDIHLSECQSFRAINVC